MPRPADRRAKIELLRAAEAVFVEHGLSAAKVEDITARAGVSKGAFYLHFESKEDCFRQIVEGFVAKLATCVGDAPPPGRRTLDGAAPGRAHRPLARPRRRDLRVLLAEPRAHGDPLLRAAGAPTTATSSTSSPSAWPSRSRRGPASSSPPASTGATSTPTCCRRSSRAVTSGSLREMIKRPKRPDIEALGAPGHGSLPARPPDGRGARGLRPGGHGRRGRSAT